MLLGAAHSCILLDLIYVHIWMMDAFGCWMLSLSKAFVPFSVVLYESVKAPLPQISDSLGHMSKTLPCFSSLLHSRVLRLKSGRGGGWNQPATKCWGFITGSSFGSQWILSTHPLRPLIAGPKGDRGPKCFWKNPSIAYPLDRNRKLWRLTQFSTLNGDYRFPTSARHYSLEFQRVCTLGCRTQSEKLLQFLQMRSLAKFKRISVDRVADDKRLIRLKEEMARKNRMMPLACPS